MREDRLRATNAMMRLGQLCVLGVGLHGFCGCLAKSETRYNIDSYLITDAEFGPAGYSCGLVGSEGFSGMGEKSDSFWVQETQTSEGIEIRWGDFSGELDARFFGLNFFEEHRMEQFIIAESGGAQHAYTIWGSDACGRCPTEHLDEYMFHPGGDVRCRGAEGRDAGETFLEANETSPGPKGGRPLDNVPLE